jgi:hypothetical protein
MITSGKGLGLGIHDARFPTRRSLSRFGQDTKYIKEWCLTSNSSLMGRVSTDDHVCDELSSHVTNLMGVQSDVWSHHRTEHLHPDQDLQRVYLTC